MTDQIDNRNALPTGYCLEDYQIQKVLGEGAFGITYLAQDKQLHNQVAIKEYLPNEFAVRDGDHTIHAKSKKDAGNFNWALDRFLEETRTLAKFKHHNIVRVLRFFQANNTAYIVMEYKHGPSLASLIKDGRTPTEEELKMLLPPLLNGLKNVHELGYLHRDITPANIYLRNKDKNLVLIVFRSALYEVGNRNRTVTAIVTPDYTPYEQYETKGDRQGPWTDIYAFGAVLYRLISGKTPVESLARIGAIIRGEIDPLTPAVEIGRGHYSQQLLESIDWALKIKEKERPQSVDHWCEKLLEKPAPPGPVGPALPPPEPVSWKRVFFGKKLLLIYSIILVIIISFSSFLLYRQSVNERDCIAKEKTIAELQDEIKHQTQVQQDGATKPPIIFDKTNITPKPEPKPDFTYGDKYGSSMILNACWTKYELAGSLQDKKVQRPIKNPFRDHPDIYVPTHANPQVKSKLRNSIRRVIPHNNEKIVALTFDLYERTKERTGYDAYIVNYLSNTSDSFREGRT